MPVGAWPSARILDPVTIGHLIPSRRVGAALAAVVLALATLTGCSENVECGVDQCTVTLDRGVDASASVFGVEAKVIGVDGDRVTVEVAGEQLQLTVGQQAAEVGGLQVAVDRVTAEEIQLRVSR